MEQHNEIPEIPQNYIDTAAKDRAEVVNIVVFEFLGTLLLVYGSLASDGYNYGIAMVYFVSLIVFGRVSGGHFNPMVTMIGYIEGTVSKKNAIYYMCTQFVASIVAGLIMLPLLNLETAPYYEDTPAGRMFGTMMAEILGSIIFFTFIQIQTNLQTRITSTQVTSAIFISVVFFIAREFTSTMDNSLFNPAAAFGLELFYGIYYGKWNQMLNLVTYMVGPWLGALSAITFYWKIYVPTLTKQ